MSTIEHTACQLSSTNTATPTRGLALAHAKMLRTAYLLGATCFTYAVRHDINLQSGLALFTGLTTRCFEHRVHAS
jgi:hypothetical protein